MEENKHALLNLIKKALRQNDELHEHFGEYPPVIKSRAALEEIESLLKKIDNYFVFRQVLSERSNLNIGILGAKVFDFVPVFKSYARTLQKIWYFIFPLNISSFTAQQALAYYFYKQHRYKDAQIASHFLGIDFYRPVFIKMLPRSRIVYQWMTDEDLQSDYYAEHRKSFPDCLGISKDKISKNGQSTKKRYRKCFKLSTRVGVLTSYSAPVLDWWSFKGKKIIPTGGGCVQYFNHNEKYFFKQINHKKSKP